MNGIKELEAIVIMVHELMIRVLYRYIESSYVKTAY